MKTLVLLVAVMGFGLLSTGCNSKTPEEDEAAKFSKVKQNTPEEEKAMRERLHLGKPLTGDPGTGVPPGGSPAPGTSPQ